MTVAELNELAVDALKRAMRAMGIEGNAAAFTRLLAGETGQGPDPTTVGRWLKGDQTVPAWALLAASRTTQIAIADLLLPEADVANVQRLLEDLQAQVHDLRSAMEEDRQAGTDESTLAKLTELAELVTGLQGTVDTQGELLQRVAKEVLPTRSELRRGANHTQGRRDRRA